MIDTSHQKKSGNSTDGTGKKHSANDYLLNINSNIAGSIFTFSHNGNLISLLAVFQKNIHPKSNQKSYQNGEGIFVSHLGKPSFIGTLVNYTNGKGPFWYLPDDDEKRHQLRCNIIHHQCSKCFIGIPLCFQKCRNHTPDAAGKNCCAQHDKYKQATWQRIGKRNHACSGCQTSHQDLPFSANVPKSHFKCRCQCQGNNQ